MNVLIFISWPVKAWSITDAHVAELRRRFPRIDFVHARTRDEALEEISAADVAFTPFLTEAMVVRAERMKWVHSSAAAVEGLLALDALARRGIVVTNSRGVQAIAIAEQVMGGLLVLSRKLNRTLEAQREKRWIQNDLTDDWPWLLHGKRMTIVGLGTIGLEIARRAHAFGMKVTGVRRNVDRPRPRIVDRIVTPEELDTALPGTDILVLATPGVAATRGMIGEREMAMLNPGAIVANVARAQVIADGVLLDGLQSERLGGAVLDVFESEPLEADSPLWAMPNVVITPHSSGFRATHWGDVLDLFSDNLRRYQRGKPLRNIVDPAAGY